MNNKNVFNNLQMINANNIMNVFDKMLQQTQLLVEDIHEGNISEKKEINSQIKNYQEKKLSNEIEHFSINNFPLKNKQKSVHRTNAKNNINGTKMNK